MATDRLKVAAELSEPESTVAGPSRSLADCQFAEHITSRFTYRHRSLSVLVCETSQVLNLMLTLWPLPHRPDAQCITILRRLADAMAEDSILLVAEMLVPERVQREDTYVYTLDLVMFMFAGRERSAVDWKKLFDESGLELIKIWPSEVGSFAMMEGRKKRT